MTFIDALTKATKLWQLVEHRSPNFHLRYIVCDYHPSPIITHKSPLEQCLNIFVRHCCVNTDRNELKSRVLSMAQTN